MLHVLYNSGDGHDLDIKFIVDFVTNTDLSVVFL